MLKINTAGTYKESQQMGLGDARKTYRDRNVRRQTRSGDEDNAASMALAQIGQLVNVLNQTMTTQLPQVEEAMVTLQGSQDPAAQQAVRQASPIMRTLSTFAQRLNVMAVKTKSFLGTQRRFDNTQAPAPAQGQAAPAAPAAPVGGAVPTGLGPGF